jgi:riboflavin kinase / FMN adenylyltransferase
VAIIHTLRGNIPENLPTAIAIGNFDGIHLGHQQTIQPTIEYSRTSDCIPTVVSFSPHPQEFFSGVSRTALTPIAEKSQILAKMGIDRLILLKFDRPLADLTADEFFDRIICQKLQAKFVSVGVDFRFGKNRTGNADILQKMAEIKGIKVSANELSSIEGSRVSSSRIKDCLMAGNVELANHLLGRNYTISGKVATGKQIGRTIGFPTANIDYPPNKFLPSFGVYSAYINIPETITLPCVVNIGIRPTVGGVLPTVEAHIPNWEGNIYNLNVTIELIHFIRQEKKFSSIEELKKQINIDSQIALEKLHDE